MHKILIVEDELLVAEDIESILQNHGFDVVGIAQNSKEALQLFHDTRPHLVLCDIMIKGEKDGIQLAGDLWKTSNVPLVYLTALSDDQTVKRASETNPAAYLVKPFTEKQLLATLNFILSTQAGEMESNGLAPTPREREILMLLAKGLNSKLIADKLNLSELTVQTHRKNLMRKYEAGSSAELVSVATRNNWI